MDRVFPAVGYGRRWVVGGLVCLAVGLFGIAPSAALEARALVDRTSISLQEVLGLTVVVRDGDGEVDVSAITDFEVDARGRSSSVQIVNTRMTREIRYRYALRPKSSGRLTIPPLTVAAGREQVCTEPIRIQVLAADDPAAAAAPVQVEAVVSDGSTYLGQTVVYTFRLLTAVQILDTRFQPPAFDGFAAVALEQQDTYRALRNGQEFRVTEVRYLLTPQRSGRLAIEPARLTVQVAAPSAAPRRRDPFGMFDDSFFRRTPVRELALRTAEHVVEVRSLPVPPAGQPFSGLVGSFQLGAVLSPPALAAGASATLTVSLEGRGNVAEAPAPELALPESFKVYAEEPETDAVAAAEGTAGHKRFRFALVPTAAGEFAVGPISLLVFDPDGGGYQRLSAGPLQLTVTPGEQQAPVLAAPGTSPVDQRGGAEKEEISQRGHDILEIYTGLDALDDRATLGPGALVTALLLPPLLYLCVLSGTARRRRERPLADRLGAEARAELRRAQDALETDPALLLTALRRALLRAVLARAGREGEGLTDEEVADLLRRAGLPTVEAQQVIQLLTQIDSWRYAGAAAGGGQLPGLLDAVAAQVQSLLRGER